MDDITIRINSRSIERIVWIVVVVFLMFLLIWTNWEEGAGTIKEKIDKVPEIEETPEPELEEEVVLEETEASEEEQEAEEQEEQPAEEEEVDETAATADPGTIIFTVGLPEKVARVSTGVKKTQYLLKSEDFASLETVYFKIDNNKKDFIPTVNVYVYDSDDIKNDYMETITFIGESKKGKIVEKVESIHISFNELDKTKTFEVELVDEGVVVKTYKKTFNFG
ncbi:hypothetical protein KY325_00060 [Candidatus Woesearchaeota archaeon]|nr:hypothetical protein [Candidatus Woesearchaeota archaeon]MBW3017539.1 hypothetical protein [Candidatus Woesearchaeota archaeon]